MPRAIVLLSTFLFILLPGPASAGTWYVKPDSTGDVINIQAGIDSSTAGDTVLVSPGIFKGPGNIDIDFMGKPIVVMTEYGPDSTAMYSAVENGFTFSSGACCTIILKSNRWSR